VKAYKDKGYLPEAMINGLALLGWNPPQRLDQEVTKDRFSKHEVLTMGDLYKMFDLEKVGNSGVKFSMDKLEYLNQMHIRKEFDTEKLT
jgi:glutamyl/glutaminyl-tRNA synthetase